MQVNDTIRKMAQAEANSVLSDLTGILAVVFATIDGFDIASAGKSDIDPAKIAAMASSISAIGTVVGQEVNLGRSKTITINSEHGFAFLGSIQRADIPMVVIVIADRNAILGQVAYRSNQVIKSLERA